jgi:hypothetical protein
MMTTTIGPETDQEKRIARLREELAKLGAQLNSNFPTGMPADMEEEFLNHVLEYERAEPITLIRLLQNSGVEVPPPDELSDEELPKRQSEIIARMAGLGAYLIHTNHLSDRELYNYLFHDGLREEAVLFPENPSYAYTIDLTGNGSDEDNQTYLKYYADEDHRQQWASDWPDDHIPDHEDLPYHRDQHLPKARLG